MWDLAAPPVPGDVPGALRELGVQIVRVQDGEIWARCPAHLRRTGKEDRNPSFSVNEELGVYFCFSCGYQGSFPNLVMDILGLEPVAAQAWITGRGSLGRLERILRGPMPPPAPPPEPSLADYVFPPAKDLSERGIDDDGAARYGLLWDQESGGFILPIREAGGALLGYQYKRGHFVRNRPRGIAKSSTLFGAHCFDGDTAVLVESPLDCARLWSAGIPGAVASFGAAVSDAQLGLLVRLAERVVIALDSDEAGLLAADQVEAKLRRRVPTTFWRYPRRTVKDPGEMTDKEIVDAYDGSYSRLERKLGGW